MKYWKPPLAFELNGPHTSECTRPNKSLALSPFPVKGILVNKIHMFQMIHNQMNSKAHADGVLICVSHLCGLNDNSRDM